MNKQAYLRMMNYGMRKNASLRERQILYKIATMNKQQGWLDDVSSWWQKGGSMKGAWQGLLKWLRELFKSEEPSSGDTGKDTKKGAPGDNANKKGAPGDNANKKGAPGDNANKKGAEGLSPDTQGIK